MSNHSTQATNPEPTQSQQPRAETPRPNTSRKFTPRKFTPRKSADQNPTHPLPETPLPPAPPSLQTQPSTAVSDRSVEQFRRRTSALSDVPSLYNSDGNISINESGGYESGVDPFGKAGCYESDADSSMNPSGDDGCLAEPSFAAQTEMQADASFVIHGSNETSNIYTGGDATNQDTNLTAKAITAAPWATSTREQQTPSDEQPKSTPFQNSATESTKEPMVIDDDDDGTPGESVPMSAFDIGEVHHRRMRDNEKLDDATINYLLKCLFVDATSWGVIDSLQPCDNQLPESHGKKLRAALDGRRALFFPIHFEDHWTCAFIHDITSSTPVVHLYDSLPGSVRHENVARKRVTTTYHALGHKRSLIFRDVVGVAKQENGVDCGLFLLIIAMYLLAQGAPPQQVSCPITWRQVFASMLCHNYNGITTSPQTSSREALDDCRRLLTIFKSRASAALRRAELDLNALNSELSAHTQVLVAASHLGHHDQRLHITSSSSKIIETLKLSLKECSPVKLAAERASQLLDAGLVFISTQLMDLDAKIDAAKQILSDVQSQIEELVVRKRKAEECLDQLTLPKKIAATG
jgi:hypothetical protein